MPVSECFRSLLPKLAINPEHVQHCAAALRTLICSAVEIDSATLIRRWNDLDIPLTAQKKLDALIERVNHGEPLQYITGNQWFWKSQFEVGPGVLIPRAETELIVEAVLDCASPGAQVAELGAGSGNIGISCLLERPDLRWFAYEISSLAVEYAQKNSNRLLARNSHYHLEHANFFERSTKATPWDLMVANPPYVKSCDLANLSPQVLKEPPIALDGGADGLSIIGPLIAFAAKHLKKRGALVFEIGEGQIAEVQRHLTTQGFVGVRVMADLIGHDRMVIARRPA